MPAAVARFSGPPPSFGYDPRHAGAAGTSATLPLGAVYNQYAPGYAAHAPAQNAAHAPQNAAATSTASARPYLLAAAIGVAVAVLLIFILQLLRAPAPARNGLRSTAVERSL